MDLPVLQLIEMGLPFFGIGILVYMFQLLIPELIKFFGHGCWFFAAAIGLVIGALLTEATASQAAWMISTLTVLSAYFYFTTKRALRKKPRKLVPYAVVSTPQPQRSEDSVPSQVG